MLPSARRAEPARAVALWRTDSTLGRTVHDHHHLQHRARLVRQSAECGRGLPRASGVLGSDSFDHTHQAASPALLSCEGHPDQRAALLEQTYGDRVYAKILVPGPPPMPALVATTDEADVLLPQLTERGWVPFGEPLPQASAGSLVVGPDRLRLVVDGQSLLDDVNPWSPPGWWAAVDQMRGRCLVVILRCGDVDLASPDAGERLAALVGTSRAVFAALPVEVLQAD